MMTVPGGPGLVLSGKGTQLPLFREAEGWGRSHRMWLLRT